MAYQALYRKYRPTTFSEIVGQDVVKKTLQNALKTGKISHAYLFSGPRGIGKTTIAKLFAKAVNCLSLKDGNPCFECANCLAASSRECPDIIEIDAASNNGVDEIRELRNKVSLVPSELNYKVYIIDEVHMLSIGAFNALLKTLEEPPSHVIFILATTDLHKVPITIVSRCQCFHFKRISEKDIVHRLKEITDLEKIEIDSEVLDEIARYCDGGMRDALGMLDKLSSYTSSKITLDDMREINGLLSESDICDFVQKIMEKDNQFVIDKLNEIYQNGKDLTRFVEDLILNLRNQLVQKYVYHDNSINDSFVNRLVLTLNQLLNDLKDSSNIKTLIEIRLLQFMNQQESVEIVTKSEKIEQVSSNSKINSKETVDVDTSIKESINPIVKTTVEEEKSNFDIELQTLRINNTFALADKKDLIDLKKKWDKIMDYTLDREIGAVACFLADATPVVASTKNIILTFEYNSMIERGNSMIDKIENALKKIFDTTYRVVLLSNDDWKKEKEVYIQNKKNNVHYEYREEVEQEIPVSSPLEEVVEDTSDLTQTAIQLFGQKIVKIDE